MALQFLMDHHVARAITLGLRLRGVNVLTAYEDGSHEISDPELLDRATDLGRVLFSQDDDLLMGRPYNKPEQQQPYDRAVLALQGLAVGDALGGFFEFAGGNARQRIAERWTPTSPWRWTDDTQMAGAVVATLRRCMSIDQDVLAKELVARYERGRGYGLATRAMLTRMCKGADWRVEAASLFGGAGSFGNGAASRVPPVGAYFADDLGVALEQAARAAAVTHAHPEARAGAMAVSGAAVLVWQQRDAPPGRAALLDEVAALLPQSQVRDGVRRACELPESTAGEDAAAELGSGMLVSCQDTVPFALWCAADPRLTFAEAIWLTLSGLGDGDTTAAIVGGIVALRCGIDGIPLEWQQNCEPPPL
jgi:ADP-ribosylglycohydrolase